MSLKHLVLGLLMSGDGHGYDVKKQYDARFPEAKPLAAAQVYATLERLERDGMVQRAGVGRAGGPDRTLFAATAVGRAALHQWLNEVEPPLPHVGLGLLQKVTLALLVADESVARSYLARQRAQHLNRMRELTRARGEQASSLARVLAADYALNHLDADLRWMETALARTDELAEQVRR